MPKRSFRGWWIMLLWVVIFVLCGEASRYFSQMFGVRGDSPGIDPPWYYIRRDFIEGICMTFGAILSFTIAGLTWKSYKLYAWMGIWFTLLWYGPAIWKASVISLRTGHLFDPTLAQTSWADFKTYSSDLLISIGRIAIYVMVLTLSFLTRRIVKDLVE